MKFVSKSQSPEGEIRQLECECGNHQIDSTTRHVQEIRCLSCGHAGIEHSFDNRNDDMSKRLVPRPKGDYEEAQQ